MEDLTFGEQVKIILGRKGMTIKELAETIEKETGKKAEKLPSTSPANAIFTLDRLTESWGAEIFGRTEENESVKGTV